MGNFEMTEKNCNHEECDIYDECMYEVLRSINLSMPIKRSPITKMFDDLLMYKYSPMMRSIMDDEDERETDNENKDEA